MTDAISKFQSRRQFLSKVIPVCAITCLGCNSALALSLNENIDKVSQNDDDFQEKVPKDISMHQLWEYRFKSNFIPVFKAIKDDIGSEKTLKILKKASSKNNFELGERFSKMRDVNDLSNFAEPFRNPREIFKQSFVYEIIEDNNTVFEIKVTKCLTAKVFRESDAKDIGYAAVCYADYSLPEGFNSKIKLHRDQTLMNGDNCCNHRYTMEG